MVVYTWRSSIRRKFLEWAAVPLCLSGVPLHAQTAEPALRQLRGAVVDQTGAIVANARVATRCGPYQSVTSSSADGRFVLNVQQSVCTLTAVAPGFQQSTRVIEMPDPEAGNLTLVLHLTGSSSSIDVVERQDSVDVSKINADPMDLPLAIETVPAQLVQDQGFTRLLDVVRNVSGVTSKEAYMGVTDTFNIRGFDASSSLFNGFRRDYYGTVNDISSLDRVEVIKGPSSVTEGISGAGRDRQCGYQESAAGVFVKLRLSGRHVRYGARTIRPEYSSCTQRGIARDGS